LQDALLTDGDLEVARTLALNYKSRMPGEAGGACGAYAPLRRISEKGYLKRSPFPGWLVQKYKY